MEETLTFNNNLSLWKKTNEQTADLVEAVDCKALHFTQTEKGERNLCTEEGEYYHDQKGAKAQAFEWFSRLDLSNSNVLYVYGVGLGYFFEAAKDWLEEEERRHLVFFEDDLRVIHRLFETEVAEGLLRHPQVDLHYFHDLEKNDSAFQYLTFNYFFQTFQVSALPLYAEKKPNFLSLLQCKIEYFTTYNATASREIFNFGSAFFSNFYSNSLQLPKSFRGNQLFGAFSDIPCIIVGAGPSLNKNLHVLEGVKDKALILAGGTAQNALNSSRVHPHFAFGVDPNRFQIPRLMMNQAFEIPYFYTGRLLHEAFKMISGPHVYLSGLTDQSIAVSLEKEIGIESESFWAGMTVTTLNLALAVKLGCNPILLVGVDLAYSEEHSYGENVAHHALHDWKLDFPNKAPEDEVLARNDIFGNPVFTLWKWIMESMWISNFAMENPEVTFINCTEGGIGFAGVSNESLAEAKSRLFKKPYDLASQVHSEIQTHPMPKQATKERIVAYFKQMQKSTKNCLKLCETIRDEFQKLKEEEHFPDSLTTDKATECLEKLNREAAYQKILDFFSRGFLLAHKKELNYLEKAGTKEAVHRAKRKEAEVYASLYNFLAKGCQTNSDSIDNALQEKEKSESVSAQVFPPGYEKPASKSSVEPFKKNELKVKAYESGAKKCEQYFLGELLHGPSRYFSESGQLLAESCFVNGVKQGKSLLFYPDGALYASLNFVDGDPEGIQQYYFPNGRLKTYLNFSQGLLEGLAWLYHENGQLARKLHFRKGKWHGKETWWNEYGQKIVEAEYAESKPINVARHWYANGQLAGEILYEDKKKVMRRWLSNGQELPLDELVKLDYFDDVTKETEGLTRSLETVVQGLQKAADASEWEDVQHLLKDVEEELSLLQKSHELMEEEAKHVPVENKELLWKTPATRKEVDRYLKEISQKMSENIETMQDTLSSALKRLGRGKKKE